MHVLTVLDHPDTASLSHAVAHAFAEGARSAGHMTELADLHAEGFDPRWSLPDLAQFDDRELPADVLAEQARVEHADAICMVFPLFWQGMPAMMKGWVDRVWSWEWAYDQTDDPEKSCQRDRTGVLLVPAGQSSDAMARDGSAEALEVAWTRGTFGYFGFNPRRLELLYGSTGSEARRKGLLDRATLIGKTLPEPGGPPPASWI